MKHCFFTLAAWLILVHLSNAPAQIPADLLEQATQLGEQLAREHLPADLLDQFEFPSPEMWNDFWGNVTSTLESGSLEDLAWMKPAVESAIEMLRLVPVGAPYADWLEQRLDYFDM
ncbi:MAG: hypothetical protein KKC51_06675, partial [Verrucomicrobia bacterium]|nr:hypothetical protein [Verrucomicrobiota bacterium]